MRLGTNSSVPPRWCAPRSPALSCQRRWQLRPLPVALGQTIPARTSLVHASLSGREAAGRLLRWLRWLWLSLLLGRHMLHEGTDGPGQRFLVAIEGVIVGGVPPLLDPLGLVVSVPIEPIDELAQHTGVDPALVVGLGEKPRLYLV